MIKKKIRARLNKTCACCGKAIRVIVYTKKDYRGGHFFGKIGLTTKKADENARKAGFTDWNFHGLILKLYKRDPVPYKFIEHWECPKCYRKK
jgi:hypothetical protein